MVKLVNYIIAFFIVIAIFASGVSVYFCLHWLIANYAAQGMILFFAGVVAYLTYLLGSNFNYWDKK